MTWLDELHSDLEHLLPMLLPAAARAATIEVAGTQLTLRIYVDGPSTLESWSELDARLTPVVERRLPAAASRETWKVIVQASRRDRPAPLDVFGHVVWLETGARLATVDGVRVGE